MHESGHGFDDMPKEKVLQMMDSLSEFNTD
jgi:hypothetical protein